MSIYRNVATLLEVTTGDTTAQTGSSYAILPQDGDKLSDAQQGWYVFFDVVQSGGVAGAMTDVILETSHDGQNWVQAVKATQLLSDQEIHEFTEVTALGPYVRAVTSLTGTPTHTAVVKLASNAPFRLRAVA